MIVLCVCCNNCLWVWICVLWKSWYCIQKMCRTVWYFSYLLALKYMHFLPDHIRKVLHIDLKNLGVQNLVMDCTVSDVTLCQLLWPLAIIVITIQGGYMNAKKQKLEKQLPSVDIQSSIFQGISVFVNGYTGMIIISVTKWLWLFSLFNSCCVL